MVDMLMCVDVVLTSRQKEELGATMALFGFFFLAVEKESWRKEGQEDGRRLPPGQSLTDEVAGCCITGGRAPFRRKRKWDLSRSRA